LELTSFLEHAILYVSDCEFCGIVPGVADFAMNTSASNGNIRKPWMADFNNEDLNLLHRKCPALSAYSTFRYVFCEWNSILMTMYVSDYNRIPLTEVITEVRRIQDLAYDLGMEEAKEMTRGKYLNILQRRQRR